jgi:hypothetical protein
MKNNSSLNLYQSRSFNIGSILKAVAIGSFLIIVLAIFYYVATTKNSLDTRSPAQFTEPYNPPGAEKLKPPKTTNDKEVPNKYNAIPAVGWGEYIQSQRNSWGGGKY